MLVLANKRRRRVGLSPSLAVRPRATLDVIRDVLGEITTRDRNGEVLTAVQSIPARDAQYAPVPAWINAHLAEAYRAKGVEQLYTHQAAAVNQVHAGKNAVIVTPTASGKTLCYNLPVLNAIL